MSRHLYFVTRAYAAEIHAFVLMQNHFHLIISTPNSNLDKIMAYLMYWTTFEITHASGRINQCFGSRHFACMMTSHHYYLHAYKYIYRNPVQAGVAIRAEDYPYSTLRGLLGLQRMHIPLIHDSTLFCDVEGTLNWLNKNPGEQNWKEVGRALRHQTFTLPKIVGSRRPSLLEVSRF